MEIENSVIETNPFNHIIYEFSMYLQAYCYSTQDQFITNLLIDSRMVHMRNLAYFFCPQSEKKEKNKKYMHYSDFIGSDVACEIDMKTYNDIQKFSSNSTCHMLRGRLNKTFKDKTSAFEYSVLPIITTRIKNFIVSARKGVLEEYRDLWLDDQIQTDINRLCELILKMDNGYDFDRGLENK